VRYRIGARPLVMYYCHCGQCRRASGSSLAANLLVAAASFAVTAGEDRLASFESSAGKRRWFCSRCGSPVFSEDQRTPTLRSVRAGTLDGDPDVRPSVHIHVDSKSPWTEIRDGLPQKPRGLADS
jgi:hypothetical protein